MYAVLKAMKLKKEISGKEEVRRVTVFMDFQATLHEYNQINQDQDRISCYE